MIILIPVDRLEVRAIIDNTTDSLSTVPSHAETEFSSLAKSGVQVLTGDHLCCACHGLSYLLTAYRGQHQRSLLFDSGPEEYAFERNAKRLNVDLGRVECIVLSHGHWDHSGGMLKALELIGDRNGRKAIPLYTHPGMFRTRARKRPDGNMMPMKDVPSIPELTAHGARVVNTTEPQLFLEEMFFLSGEIPRVTPFERGLPGHFRRTEDGKDWEPDPWIMDERFLTVNVHGKGLVVFTACSHAGVVNVLRHAREFFPAAPIHAVMGGFHLAGPTEAIIGNTVDALRPFDLQVIAAGHCTGWRAITALSNAFGGKVDPTVVGKRYNF
jgi:7,8-dihydropterin-6-yl-methyl-4-(beta-D-ribofuranosyl)aminobenzene 5'-phosphate synthase